MSYKINKQLSCFLPLFLFIFLGAACQKSQAPADTVVAQSTIIPSATKEPIPSATVTSQPTSESHQKFDSIYWEWMVPSKCSFISISPENIWVIYYCEKSEHSGIWIKNILENSAPILLLKVYPWPSALWSPNGKMVAISTSRKDIWLFNIDDWEKKQMLYDASNYPDREGTPLPYNSPIWSPNNEYLAMLNPHIDKTLVLFKPNGTEIPLLYSSEFHDPNSTDPDNPSAFLPHNLSAGPVWSADSKKIAFLVIQDIKNPYSSALWIWDLELNDYSVAFELDHDFIVKPVWSPDGRMIAFLGDQEIVLYSLVERTIERIEFDQEFSHLDSILWSPNSKHMLVNISLARSEDESKEWHDMTSEQRELLESNIWGSWLLTLEDEEWQMLDFDPLYVDIIKWIGNGDELRFVVERKELDQEIVRSVIIDLKH